MGEWHAEPVSSGDDSWSLGCHGVTKSLPYPACSTQHTEAVADMGMRIPAQTAIPAGRAGGYDRSTIAALVVCSSG